MSVYEYSATTIDGKERSLSEYNGRVLLIVNTASKCGFTPQYKELQELYEQYREQGFEVLGFPSNQFMNQEPGEEGEIREFCELNYGVTFPLFAKTDVKGENAHPLFRYLSKNAPGIFFNAVKWNFTKFLVSRKGEVIGRYAPATKPSTIRNDIEKALAQ
ncbi:glutathione peroxidase [Melghirimyces algeriensis]|uniref:Glutathione peroxidase n=1 Tax=Melghirimyces algeriensis TaxID=910412 RepID=A0A521CWI4_9BACL|nr:glutathione peroxidase [Melghirimyces algeriensis]SMO63768.1 glutathione peroxidase [Melghirimyces algeriensis]